ncbi:3-oxoacyl-ACP reductase (plasmid) [Coxiella burnetii]|uniref:3-oxoacyl-[acyl-carrier protein] reductase n=2 Tax=Coxiella burnetii TaxID=777 RepID=A9KH48_COXBN|nr:glucose 1-dehydrogenase [Coxiella burnetii]ABS78545.1 3-oxoacyl-[acyl-carrier protein] reductase [Coxiella burnetii Dugway 5J108-111]OYK79193.1 3-oxoacyl-ACP reductase [Coxiella burnetii]OYK81232.1 3-oxoacyl-ACP reductase [Coxiella burnetii]
MNDYSVKDKVVIVTGATKGMGLASSKQFLKMGSKVVMVYFGDAENARKVEAALSDYPAQLLLIKADITKAEDRQRIIDETINTFQRINVLVNNAGIPAKAGFLKEAEEDFNRVIDVNLKAPIFLAKLVAEQMIKQAQGGSIINFSSVAGHRAMGGISYDAAKAGIIRASQTMANTLGKYGIRVNSISPGTHKTEMNRYQWENRTELYENMIAVTALKRAAEADEMAGTVLYLASDQSSYTTGTDILVDGGYLSHCPGR